MQENEEKNLVWNFKVIKCSTYIFCLGLTWCQIICLSKIAACFVWSGRAIIFVMKLIFQHQKWENQDSVQCVLERGWGWQWDRDGWRILVAKTDNSTIFWTRAPRTLSNKKKLMWFIWKPINKGMHTINEKW